eukprot:4988383-Prymnesium_polylepis.1
MGARFQDYLYTIAQRLKSAPFTALEFSARWVRGQSGPVVRRGVLYVTGARPRHATGHKTATGV